MKAVALQSTSDSGPAGKHQTAKIAAVPVSPWCIQPSALAGPVLQRKSACACGGDCPRCETEAGALNIQTKLAVSTPGDKFEQEADAVADQVMRMPDPILQRHSKCRSDPSVPGSSDDVREPRSTGSLVLAGTTVQRRAHEVLRPSNVSAGAGGLVSSGGRPLDHATHGFMASRFGVDFSEVRVHDGGEAARSAAELNAAAYTVGSDVVFGAGRYRPHASEGLWLLAHELTHVLQQSVAPVAPKTAQRVGADDETPAYDVNDAITQLTIALAAASVALKDSALPAARRTRIIAQQQKLQPLLAELREKGDKATLSFDPAPHLNEVHAGDSGKTLSQLYGGAAPPQGSPRVSANENPSPGAETPAVQAFALPGGLTITPMTSPVVQRFAFIAVGVIVLAGLLLSGCRSSTPACVPPAIPPGGFPLTLKPIIARGTLWETDATQRGYIGVRTTWARATWRTLAQVDITVAPEEVHPIATEVTQPTLSSIGGAHGGSRSTIVVIFLHKTCRGSGWSLCPQALTSHGPPPAIGMPVVDGGDRAVGDFETGLGHELGHVLLRHGDHAVSGLMQHGGPYPAALTAEEICNAQKYF